MWHDFWIQHRTPKPHKGWYNFPPFHTASWSFGHSRTSSKSCINQSVCMGLSSPASRRSTLPHFSRRSLPRLLLGRSNIEKMYIMVWRLLETLCWQFKRGRTRRRPWSTSQMSEGHLFDKQLMYIPKIIRTIIRWITYPANFSCLFPLQKPQKILSSVHRVMTSSFAVFIVLRVPIITTGIWRWPVCMKGYYWHAVWLYVQEVSAWMLSPQYGGFSTPFDTSCIFCELPSARASPLHHPGAWVWPQYDVAAWSAGFL